MIRGKVRANLLPETNYIYVNCDGSIIPRIKKVVRLAELIRRKKVKMDFECLHGKFNGNCADCLDSAEETICNLKKQLSSALKVINEVKSMRFENRFDCTIVEANDWEQLMDVIQNFDEGI